MPLRVPCHGRARPGPCATVSDSSAVSTPYAPGPLQRGHMGGCHASASITIRGWSMQRLPTVIAHIAVLMAALYHSLSSMQIVLAGVLVPTDLVFSVIVSLTNLHNLSYACKNPSYLLVIHSISICCSLEKSLLFY